MNAAHLWALALAVAWAASPNPVLHAADPLPSWNDTAPKQAIIQFIERTTRPGSPEAVPPGDRIAVFDNDGTLWAEQPVYVQASFILHRRIGRRPRLAFGNSDGDFEMLEWTRTGPGPRLGLLLHHTDPEREWAYDRDSQVGRLRRGLDEAPGRGWIVVDMKRDWNRVFPAKP